MKICILGNTLFSATLSAVFASVGNTVLWSCCPLESSPIKKQDHYEKELSLLLETQIQESRLQLIDFENIIFSDCDVIILGFGPAQKNDIITVCQKLAQQNLSTQTLMINISTLGVGSTQQLQQYFHLQHSWAYIPDNIQEGRSLDSLMRISALVVGRETIETENIIQELFRPFFRQQQSYLFMPIQDAEFTKLAISGMLATRISFMNDMANTAEKLHIDIENVRQGMGIDDRIGSAYLSPGCGFGGSNFSQDILMLSDMEDANRSDGQLLQQVWHINQYQKEVLFRKFWQYYHAQIQGKTVAIWGAAFKPQTDSIINSPIHETLAALWSQNVKVKLHDPLASWRIQEQYGEREDLMICSDMYEALKDTDALMLLTEWQLYTSPDFKKIKSLMKHPLILDGRNVYSPEYVKKHQIDYYGVGRYV